MLQMVILLSHPCHCGRTDLKPERSTQRDLQNIEIPPTSRRLSSSACVSSVLRNFKLITVQSRQSDIYILMEVNALQSIKYLPHLGRCSTSFPRRELVGERRPAEGSNGGPDTALRADPQSTLSGATSRPLASRGKHKKYMLPCIRCDGSRAP